jgi:hypothetical protein
VRPPREERLLLPTWAIGSGLLFKLMWLGHMLVTLHQLTVEGVVGTMNRTS